MNIVGFITSQTLFDILYIFVLLAALVLGFVQGAIRRALGIVALLVAFLIAANLREPVGEYLAQNWRQFPHDYSVMLGFLALFLLLWLGLSALIQGFYRRSLIYRSEALDEIAGAILGVVWAMLLVGILGLILDTYFTIPSTEGFASEIGVLRTLQGAWDVSGVAALYRETLMPAFFQAVGFFVPDTVESFVGR